MGGVDGVLEQGQVARSLPDAADTPQGHVCVCAVCVCTPVPVRAHAVNVRVHAAPVRVHAVDVLGGLNADCLNHL